MREGTRKVSIVLTFWVIIGLFFWYRYRVAKTEENVKENGVEVRAKIIDRHYAKGWIMSVEYYCGGKRYTCDTYISEFVPEIGDSLIIKVLPSEPGKSIIVKEKIFSVPPKSYAN
jgi:hypothetical protein